MGRKAAQSETVPAIAVKFQCRFQRQNNRRLLKVPPPSKPQTIPPNQIPYITRLLALAHYYQKQLDEGVFRNYAEIAQAAKVSRARITQIMCLVFLAPEIQEEIINLSNNSVLKTEKQIRTIAKIVTWEDQVKRYGNFN